METKAIYNAKGGVRWEHDELPEAGKKFKDSSGRIHTFDGLGPAGMLLFTEESGFQSAYMPPHLESEGFEPLP